MAIGVDGSTAVLTPQERLQERLADPKTVDALNRLLDRLDVIVFTAEALEGFLRRAEVVADSVAQGVADVRKMAGEEGGADLLGNLPRMVRAGGELAERLERPEVQRLLDSGLLEKLAEPGTLESLKALLGRLELVGFLLEGLDGFLRRSDTWIESVAAGIDDLKQAAPEIDGEKIRRVVATLPSLVDAGTQLSEAGMFDPKTVQVLANLGRTVAASHDDVREKPQKPLGLFDLLRSLRDPEIQSSVRLALYVAKRYGRGLGGS
jgi:Protein of unknown function (DUF1641)